MNYTDEQYAMLDFFKLGARWTDVPETSMPVYWYLMEQKLICPREDIQPDWVTLTEYGKCVFSDHLVSLEQMNKAMEKDAKQEKQQRFNNKIAVADLSISLASFLVGIIIEFYVGIYSRAVEWWSKLEVWLTTFFS